MSPALVVDRYFRLRRAAKSLGLKTRWFWSNTRLLRELFDFRCRQEVERCFVKRRVILDFRSYNKKLRAEKK